jgi:hypothetical protein
VATEPRALSGAGAHDFDFLWGAWRIEHERLTSRLTGSDDWERFDAMHECWPILGGTGNVDNMRATVRGQPFEGASLRLFDPATGLWSIYWADSVRHALQEPVAGAFANGVGEFYADEQLGEQHVRVRFVWSEITPDSARWEQACSLDDGASWETNWIMSFTRIHQAGQHRQEARS